jgi:protease II
LLLLTHTQQRMPSLPRWQAVRAFISSYSPLHNLDPARASDLPAMLLTASLHDTRVNFW